MCVGQICVLFDAAEKAEHKSHEVYGSEDHDRLSKGGFFMLCALGRASFSKVMYCDLAVGQIVVIAGASYFTPLFSDVVWGAMAINSSGRVIVNEGVMKDRMTRPVSQELTRWQKL